MSKKLVALRAAALLGAMSGATLIASVGSPVQAAEESCWDNKLAPTKHHHTRGCAYDQYGLAPGLRPGDGGEAGTNGATDGGSGGPVVNPPNNEGGEVYTGG